MAVSPNGLALPRVLAYASLATPLAGIGLGLSVFLSPFYAEHMGVGVATTGAIFMLLRVWDLLIDPVMGYLVDTKPSRFGRVRHWLILAVPVLGFATYFLFVPSGSAASPTYLVLWLMVFMVGFTLVQTPSFAWVPAIAPDYDERSRIFMWFEIFSITATLGFLILPVLIGGTFPDKVNFIGHALIVLLVISVGLACIAVPDPKSLGANHQKADMSRKALLAAVRNGPLTRILLAYICIGVAVSGTAATYLWAARWGFGIDGTDTFVGIPLSAELVLVVFFVSTMICMPAWIAWSKRVEKHRAVMWICIISGLSFLGYLPLRQLNGVSFWWMCVGAFLSGMGFSAAFTLLRSMQGDLVEVERARSGSDRSGLYYALMTASYKTGASLAIGIPYILLGVLVGFDPKIENSPEAVNGLMYVFVGIPFLFYCLAALIIRKYPITRQAHADAIAKYSTSSV